MHQAPSYCHPQPSFFLHPTAEIVTYRLDVDGEQDLVYVQLAETYDDAVKTAQSSFSHLKNTPVDSIQLVLNVNIRGQCNIVRISPSAWPAIRRKVTQYEILDIKLDGGVPSSSTVQEPSSGKTRTRGSQATRQKKPYARPSAKTLTMQ